jgi:hypothetical protein
MALKAFEPIARCVPATHRPHANDGRLLAAFCMLPCKDNSERSGEQADLARSSCKEEQDTTRGSMDDKPLGLDPETTRRFADRTFDVTVARPSATGGKLVIPRAVPKCLPEL